MKKIYLIYLFLALSLLPFFQYQFNPDASAYIGIAQKYWAGNFYQAINGYWSPLYSWLMLPFFALKIPFPLGAKILNILLGLIGVVGVNRLLNHLKLSYSLKLVGGLLAALFLLKCALIIITPDLLATVILTFYLVLILEKKPLISTIVGVLAYLAKAYNFYFILLTFVFYQLYSYLNQKTKTKKQVVVKQTVLGLLIFFLISIGWILIISLKYHKFTISTALNYNYLVINPYHWGLPIHNQGLIPPVNPTALSAWEDPSFHSVNKWHPFINSTTLIYQLLVIKNNLVDIIKYYQQFAALSLIIIITFLIKILEVDSKLRLVFLLLIIYPLGYLPLAIQDRYLWFSELLLLILGIKILASLLKHTQNKNQRFLILLFFILFFIKPQFSEIRWYFNVDKNLYQLSQRLKSYKITQSKIAALSEGNDWNNTLTLAYYSGNQYYGLIQKNTSWEKIKQQLQKYNINYFFVYKTADKFKLLNQLYPIIFYDQDLDLTVYKIN